MIVSGSRDATLQQIRLVDIHGTYFYDIVYMHDDEQQPRQARFGKDDVYAEPQPGDAVRVAYLMNVATGVQQRG